MRVLHLTEALGGGVMTAIEGYVRATPELEHVVHGRPRAGHDVGAGLESVAMVRAIDGDLTRFARAAARAVIEEDPDVVHLHSTIGAGVARLLPQLRRRSGVVYSPHCFAFERTDVRPVVRAAIRVAERTLSHRTDVVVSNGRYEADLAAALRPSMSVFDAPCLPVGPTRALRPHDGFVAATVGRMSPQKDVDWFCAVVRSSPSGIRWRWIGGGDRSDEQRVRGMGVEVTGWRSRQEVQDLLASSDVYAHTAAWEAGAALSLLEASTMGLPIVSRRIPAIGPWPIRSFGHPGELAAEVAALRDPGAWHAESGRSMSLVGPELVDRVASALTQAYAAAAAAGARRRRGVRAR